jgi:hypothetical protein
MGEQPPSPLLATTTTTGVNTTTTTTSNSGNISAAQRQIPIVCPGHTRPLAELQFISMPDDNNPQRTLLVSACHDRFPMVRRSFFSLFLINTSLLFLSIVCRLFV